MLTFLRRIRRSLIESSAFRKYILYAIGEIALVVIGILIALQINNWNSDRIDRKEEQLYLKRLVQDLEQDLVNIQDARNNHEKRLLVGTHVLESLGDNNVSRLYNSNSYKMAIENRSKYDRLFDLPFAQQLFEILKIDLFYLTDDTYQELISTGKIDIIQDPELKQYILSHYPSVGRDKSFQDNIVFTVQSKYRDAMDRSEISYLDQSSFEDLKSGYLLEKDLVVAIENYLSLTQGFLGVLDFNEDSTKKQTESLIKAVKGHIR